MKWFLSFGQTCWWYFVQYNIPLYSSICDYPMRYLLLSNIESHSVCKHLCRCMWCGRHERLFAHVHNELCSQNDGWWTSCVLYFALRSCVLKIMLLTGRDPSSKPQAAEGCLVERHRPHKLPRASAASGKHKTKPPALLVRMYVMLSRAGFLKKNLCSRHNSR